MLIFNTVDFCKWAHSFLLKRSYVCLYTEVACVLQFSFSQGMCGAYPSFKKSGIHCSLHAASVVKLESAISTVIAVLLLNFLEVDLVQYST